MLGITEMLEAVDTKTRSMDKEAWGRQFRNCFSDTLLRTLHIQEDGSVYLVTGDIPAMWLRDSTAQIEPYLVLAKTNVVFQLLIAKLVQKQCEYILIDPYANAFNEQPNSHGHQTDQTIMSPWVWERKYEIDSLCYPVRLAYLLYEKTGYTDHFNDTFLQAVREMVNVFTTEQHHETSDYSFERFGARPEDTLVNDGKGSPLAYTGMTWSGFRPSDDACQYGYLVPANMFAVVILTYLTEIIPRFYTEDALVADIIRLRDEIQAGIEKFGIVEDKHTGKKIFAYEVDGLGNYTLMDDANVPSLLSAPYLGYCDADDDVYLNTRELLLSDRNPYYYSGTVASGIGSSHTPEPYIWPIALSIQGLTTNNRQEKERLLDVVVGTTAGTMQCHESFDVNDEHQYTREWFSWSNMMYCQLLLNYLELDE
ncbi:glycoside hydrolase family 125 protein [Paenibacillus massiliensis]|uniref:glycoside hydrolase family 125 protein n=1 Tax=Paenibacillus massiliensis TaxID=225917 RepID=UPI0003783F07|nr:glycoside hydrolase family 125 protein [Paenibacillus massiliensis]